MTTASPNPIASPTASPTASPYAEAMPPLRLFFGLRGRVSRRQYWLYGVLALIGLAVLGQALLGIARVSWRNADLIVNLLLVWPALAEQARRAGFAGKTVADSAHFCSSCDEPIPEARRAALPGVQTFFGILRTYRAGVISCRSP